MVGFFITGGFDGDKGKKGDSGEATRMKAFDFEAATDQERLLAGIYMQLQRIADALEGVK